ncbi:MAG: very short patch repair endonuclease [Gemmataceae bacterium]
MIVRRFLHGGGFRYSLHRRGLPASPDLVLARYRSVILIHGCFWHVHDCPLGRVKPKTNSAFWSTKRLRNVEVTLKAAGHCEYSAGVCALSGSVKSSAGRFDGGFASGFRRAYTVQVPGGHVPRYGCFQQFALVD